MDAALLELTGVGRSFRSGTDQIQVLHDINLSIRHGEMLAIVGTSGSGKSTLMNILGCLDRPDSGHYRVGGMDVADLAPDELARLRREHFGFVFQRYHLLPRQNTQDNVAMPAIYAGISLAKRRARAASLLDRLGLASRQNQIASQLSGGQQQRVSIARALMNGGTVILADEPTGALDSKNGQEVIAILRELNQAGHTIIIVTHDRQIAACADRIIELCDGEILSDTQIRPSTIALLPPESLHCGTAAKPAGRMLETFKMAMSALRVNRLRTLLTMLGIIIGIASVTAIIALGQGAREAVLKDIRSIGTNTLFVYRGQDWADDKANSIYSLQADDLKEIAAQPYVDSVTPQTGRTMRLRRGGEALSAYAYGAGEDIFRVMGRSLSEGRGISADDVRRQAQVVVIDQNTRRKLFGDHHDALGQVIMVGSMPAQVIGIANKASAQSDGNQLVVWLPYSTAASRLFGQSWFDSLTIRAREGVPMDQVEQQITQILTLLHGKKDFFIDNMDRVYQSINRVTRTLSLLLSLVALISLLVGGIGVMNIMLVSVAERTREIGIRMAVGARASDVMLQFLIEAVLVCLIGGVAGIALALGIGLVFSWFVDAFRMIFSFSAILMALLCSVVIGVLFGFLPARNAARMDPIVALARE